MPKFVGKPVKSRGRSGRLWVNARRQCLANSQICYICAGECPDLKYDVPPFGSAAIDMTKKWPDPASPSVDHVIPISQLSENDPRLYRQDNLRSCHLGCNSRRGDGTRPPAEIKTRTSRNWLA